MFKVGELIKRKTVSNRARAVCVVVDKDEHNYTIYNKALDTLQLIAIPVIDGMYSKVEASG
tara:strand:- start:1826 stop:2008 length:183 start_codon:yes stop_codon:yes gene_type:complete